MKYFFIDISFDDDTGVSKVSLVETPATNINFLKFSEQKKQLNFTYDSSQHILTGVVMLADTPIYRWDREIGDYYIIFTKDVIAKMILKYSKNNFWNNVNLEHQNDVDGVYMLESYQVNKDRGIEPKEFTDIPDGSWIMSYKVENEELWNKIMLGEFKGFSLEGLFEVDAQVTLDELIDELLQ